MEQAASHIQDSKDLKWAKKNLPYQFFSLPKNRNESIVFRDSA